jgi:hypothetical protein
MCKIGSIWKNDCCGNKRVDAAEEERKGFERMKERGGTKIERKNVRCTAHLCPFP